MGFGLPGWMLGFVIALVIISLAKNVRRGAGMRSGRSARLQNEDEIEQRLADIERSQGELGSGDTAALERRVAEMEERLDFAERMLARQSEAERLAPPRHV